MSFTESRPPTPAPVPELRPRKWHWDCNSTRQSGLYISAAACGDVKKTWSAGFNKTLNFNRYSRLPTTWHQLKWPHCLHPKNALIRRAWNVLVGWRHSGMTMSLHLKSSCDRQDRKWKGPSKAFGSGHDQPETPLKSSTPTRLRLCHSLSWNGTMFDLKTDSSGPLSLSLWPRGLRATRLWMWFTFILHYRYMLEGFLKYKHHWHK